MIIKICPTCKKELESQNHFKNKQRFCDRKCYQQYHSKNTWKEFTCEKCGLKFTREGYRTARFCSLKCSRQSHVITLKLVTKYPIKCKHCGNDFLIRPSRAKGGRGKFCSRKCYAIWMSINMVGEKATGWRGGVTYLYDRIRSLQKYEIWKKSVKKRDDYQCTNCGSKEQLEVDHIYGFYEIIIENHITSSLEANKCEKLWDINNGRTLCLLCHRKTPDYGVTKTNKIIKAKKIIKDMQRKIS